MTDKLALEGNPVVALVVIASALNTLCSSLYSSASVMQYIGHVEHR